MYREAKKFFRWRRLFTIPQQYNRELSGDSTSSSLKIASSRSPLVYVNYIDDTDPKLYRKEFEYFRTQFSPSNIPAIYVKSGTPIPEYIWKELALFGMAEKYENTLEISLSLLKSFSCLSRTYEPKFSSDANRLCARLSSPFEVIELRDTFSVNLEKISTKNIAVDIPSPCLCDKNFIWEWFESVCWSFATFSHVTLEQYICPRCRQDVSDNDDIFLEIYKAVQKICTDHNFTEYKFRYFSKHPKFFSRYMQLLSRGNPYIGIGPGAHSRIGQNARLAKVTPSTLKDRAYEIADLDHKAELRRLSNYECVAEILLHGLDTTEGISLERLLQYLDAVDAKCLNRLDDYQFLIANGKIETSGASLKVPKENWPVLTSIVTKLLEVFEENGLLANGA